jgi:hypothetical protein
MYDFRIPKKVLMIRRKKCHGKAWRKLGTCRLDECRRFAPEAGLEGGSKEEKSLKKGDQGGHGPKTGLNTIEEEEKSCRYSVFNY